jgi:ATP-binding cassette subfamily B protein
MSENKKQSNRSTRQGRGPGSGMPFSRPAEKAKDFKGTLKRLIKYIGEYRFLLIIMIVITITTILLGVIAPNFSRFIINDLQEIIIGTLTKDEGVARITTYLIIVISLYISRFLMDIVVHLIGNRVSINIGKKMRNDLRLKLEKLPMKYFDSRQTGDILSVFSNDVDVVSNSIQQSLINIISSLFAVLGILVMMFIISWRLTIIALLILPLFVLATSAIAKRSQSKFIRQQKQLGTMNGFIEEVFSASKIVKLFGKEEDSYEKFQKINIELAEDMKGAQFLSGLIRPIMEFISNIGYVAVVLVGGILAGATNPLLIGDITIFILYQKNFVNPILNIANVVNQLQSTIAGAERIIEVLDGIEEIQDYQDLDLKEGDSLGHVIFKNIDFSYSEDTELIKDLDLEVLPGKQIAIVGPTGAGKTTLVNLLMRFYEVNKGNIIIDGIDSTAYPRAMLRKQFGMVLQDTWLFSGTIRENIAFGKPEATDEEIIYACKQAHVHHYIETLPLGYDTILKEDADNISKGQKQLLTIARAILFNPKILILDEATSSVDTRTESYIQNAMSFMMEGKTSFVIAHRLSTIKKANLILVMNHGQIVEQGTHKELLNQKGVYAELYNSQFLNQPI